MAAMSKIRQASQLSPPNAAPKRWLSLRARRIPHRRTLGALQKTHAGPSALTLVRGCDEILSLGWQCAEIFVQYRRHIDRFALEAERVQRPGQMTG